MIVVDGRREHNVDVRREQLTSMEQPDDGMLGGAGILVDHPVHVQRRIVGGRRGGRALDDVVQKRSHRAGVEHHEQDALLRRDDPFTSGFEIDRAAHGRKPHLRSRRRSLRRGADDVVRHEQIAGILAACAHQLVPLREIPLRDLPVLDQDGVVRLRAQSGGRPVGAARPHRTAAVGVRHDQVLVVGEVGGRDQPVAHVDAAAAQRRAGVGVLVIGLGTVRQDHVRPGTKRLQ